MGRGFSLSQLHSQTQGNWVGTHQSEDSEGVWGSHKEYGEGGSSIRDGGLIYWYWKWEWWTNRRHKVL